MPIFNFVKSILAKREAEREERERRLDGKLKYEKALQHALSDNDLSDDEKKELRAIEDRYGLSDEDVRTLQKAAMSSFYGNICADQRITQDEEKTLGALLEHFGLTKDDINYDKQSFNKYYLLALVESGVLPEISKEQINIEYRKGEILHFGWLASLRKHKKSTRRINYHGITGSIRIMKGLSYRVGSLNFDREIQTVLTVEDSGVFFLTNLRIGFLGQKKHFSLPYSKISSFEVNEDGLFIFKEGRESAYIIGLEDYEVVCAIVSFILNKD